MEFRLPSQRTLALLVIASLALLALCSKSDSPPEIPIADLPKLDGGSVVTVVGVVVDAWSSDSGSNSFVVADIERLATVRIVCSAGTIGPSAVVHIGDEVRASGELEVLGGRPTLWTTQDDVLLTRASRDILTVDGLSKAWTLLIDDRFEVRGLLCSSGSAARLADPDSGESILLRIDQGYLTRFADRIVILDSTLRLDSGSMSLVLEVHSVSPGS